MSVNLQSVEATMLPDGSVHMLEPVKLSEPTQVIITFAVENKEPNEQTQAAMQECLDGLPGQPRFDNVDELLADLNS